MTALYATVFVVLAAGSLTLLCHPLVRFLKASEVPAALAACLAGRSYRRRLAFVLRARRECYLDDIAGLPPEYLWVVLAWRRVAARLAFAWRHGPLVRPRPVPPPEKVKLPGPVTAGLLAQSAASPRGIGASFIAAGAITATQLTAADFTFFPDHRNPWAGQVNAELAAHRAEAEANRVTFEEVAVIIDAASQGDVR